MKSEAKMSEALDQWEEAKSRLDNARSAILEIARTIDAMASTIGSYAAIEPGKPAEKMVADYSSWPTADVIAKAVQELNMAHLVELNAFNSLEPEEQVIASANRVRGG